VGNLEEGLRWLDQAGADMKTASRALYKFHTDFKKPFLERIKVLLDLNDDIGLSLQPIGYTPEEFRKMREERNRFI